MKILAIDTCSPICSVAVLENEQVLNELYIDDSNTHSTKLMPLIDELLKKADLTLDDIDLFACGIGPGSFTGIRIGVSTIKAFADVTSKPVVGVTSLEALSLAGCTETGLVCSLIDAKHDNVYFGAFEYKNSKCVKTSEFLFENINNIIDFVKNKNNNIIFVGNGSTLFKSMIESKLDNCKILDTFEFEKNIATAIGIIAFRRYEEGLYGDSNSLIPLYIKKSNAEI